MRELKVNLEEIVNSAIRSCRGEFYYFDENGIYKKVSSTEAEKILNNVFIREDGSAFCSISYNIRDTVNLNLFNKALGKLKIGDDFNKLRNIYQEIEFDFHERPEGLDRFITKIDSPQFIRMPQNQDLKVFDFIYIDVFVVTEWESDIYKYILANRKEITNKVINKLKNNKSFQKYSVPINFLKLTKCTYSKGQNFIRFVFELKKLNNSQA